jgi:hypothetical protein
MQTVWRRLTCVVWDPNSAGWKLRGRAVFGHAKLAQVNGLPANTPFLLARLH